MELFTSSCKSSLKIHLRGNLEDFYCLPLPSSLSCSQSEGCQTGRGLPYERIGHPGKGELELGLADESGHRRMRFAVLQTAANTLLGLAPEVLDGGTDPRSPRDGYQTGQERRSQRGRLSQSAPDINELVSGPTLSSMLSISMGPVKVFIAV